MEAITTTAVFTADDLSRVAQLLADGECIAVPTETVYGLAANALDARACQRIFAIKGRPLIDPLIVHCRNMEMALAYGSFSALALRLAEAFWPGPLTLVLGKDPVIPDIVTAGLPSVALRVPGQALLVRLLQQLDFPLAAPSANPFGYVSPTKAEHVLRTLGGRIAGVLDGGACEHGLESTIVDVRDATKPRLLRPGPIDRAELEAHAGCSFADGSAAPLQKSTGQIAPGALESHYSPQAVLRIFPAGDLPMINVSEAALRPSAKVFWQRPSRVSAEHYFWLSEGGDSVEAAHNLFELLNRLDAMGYQQIDCESCPHGLAMAEAINDRLRRAAVKRV